MYPETHSLSSDLDWMMQSPQISDAQLIQALTQEFHTQIYNLTVSITGDRLKSSQVAEQTIFEAVSNRRRFWGSTTLKAWLFYLAVRLCQEKSKGQGFIPRLRSILPGRSSHWKVVSQLQPGDLPVEHRRLGESLLAFHSDGIRLLYLRYVQGLTVHDIAYILKTSEGSLLSHLREMRQKMQAQERGSEASQASPAGHCRIYRQDVHAGLDGHLDGEKQVRLKQHTIECPDCQSYSNELVEFDLRLARCVQASWPESNAPGVPARGEFAGMGENVGKTRQHRRAFRLVKEVSVGAAAILIVFALASMGNLTAGEANPTPPPANPMSAAEAGSLGEQDTLAQPNPDLPVRGNWRAWASRQQDSSFQSDPSNSKAVYLEFQSLKEHWSPSRQDYDLNQSGSVNLHLLLHFWGERGNPLPYLQPNPQDETVMFSEMVGYIQEHTGLQALMRMGGEIGILEELIKAGIPVMVQKGFDGPGAGDWAGHYAIVNGFDIVSQSLMLLAAYPEDGGDTPIAFDDFEQNWRSFNYSYMVVYPPRLADQVQKILGTQFDPEKNYTYAAIKATEDIEAKPTGRDLFFAWYNRGTSLTYLEDYPSAKDAFEQAFSIYALLSEEERPWRILWYQPRPYWAYFYTGDYQMVIDLSTSALESMEAPILEESFYWRALAKEALGDSAGAIQDLNEAVRLNPNFTAGIYQLKRIKNES